MTAETLSLCAVEGLLADNASVLETGSGGGGARTSMLRKSRASKTNITVLYDVDSLPDCLIFTAPVFTSLCKRYVNLSVKYCLHLSFFSSFAFCLRV